MSSHSSSSTSRPRNSWPPASTSTPVPDISDTSNKPRASSMSNIQSTSKKTPATNLSTKLPIPTSTGPLNNKDHQGTPSSSTPRLSTQSKIPTLTGGYPRTADRIKVQTPTPFKPSDKTPRTPIPITPRTPIPTIPRTSPLTSDLATPINISSSTTLAGSLCRSNLAALMTHGFTRIEAVSMLSALPNDGGYVGAVGEALDTHKRNSDLQGLYEKLERLVERDFADISRVHKEEAAVVLEGIHKKLEDCAREEAVPLWRCLRSKLLEKEKLYTRIREEETRVVGTLTLDGGRWQSMRSVTEEQVKVSPVVRRPEPLDHGQESPRPLMTIGMGLRRGRGENNTAEQNTLNMEHITVASPPKEPGVPESSTLEWAKREGKSLTRMEISVPPQTVTARELIPKTSPSPPSSTSSISSSDTDKKHISHGLGSTNSPLRKSHSYLLRRGFNSKEAFEMLKVLPGNGHYAGAGEDAEKEYIELKIGAMADMYDEFTEKLNNEFEHFSESHKDMADQLFKSRIVWINYRHKHSPEKYPVGQCYTEKLLEREKIYTEIDHEHYGGFGAEKKKAESSRQWGQEILGKTKVPRSPEMPDTFDNETGSYLRESPKDSVRRGEWAKTETPYPFAKPPVQQRQYSVEDPFMQTRNLSPPNSSPSIVVSNAFLRDVIAETTDFELKSIAIDAQFPDFSADDRRVALKHLAKIWKDLDKIPSNRLLEEMLSLKEELYQRLDAHRRQGRQAEKDRETERSLDSWRAQVAETEKMRRRFIMVGLAVAGMAVVVACISPEMAIFLMVFLAAGAWFRCGGVMRP